MFSSPQLEDLRTTSKENIMAKKRQPHVDDEVVELGEHPPQDASESPQDRSGSLVGASDGANATLSPYDAVKTKIEAIRLIRADLLKDGKQDTPAAVYDVYRRTKHSLGDEEKDRNYITSTLSQLRRVDGDTGRKARNTVSTLNKATDKPTVDELKKVKALVQEHGGIDEVAKLVDAVAVMAKAVGGFDRLKTALDDLRELMS
jgi:hypothetical protein